MKSSLSTLHGRKTQYFESGDRYEGKFCDGMKHGKGTFFFSDESSLSGTWLNDELQGIAYYTFPDGRLMEAEYKNGELHGWCIEYDCAGNVIFHGQYHNGIRFGVCHAWDEFGGHVFGTVSRQGSFSGSNITYVYPDKKTALVGHFRNGDMIEAEAAMISNGENLFVPIKSASTYRKDVSTRTCISKDPLLPDIYESQRVFVAPSKIAGAGEGLFSKIRAQKGEVMSFYNGIRLSHEEVDARDWSLNGNTISLDDTAVIDVPPEYSDLSYYCASLGHKANHSFTPNCKYDRFDHPRFGDIKCIRTIQPVETGQELTVSYGYNHQELGQEAPPWYKQAAELTERGD